MAYDSFVVNGGTSPNFYVTGPDAPDDLELDITYTHIPGGPYNYVDIGGAKNRQLNLKLFFVTEADYLAMVSLCQGGVAGTLTYQEFSGGVAALLVSCKRETRALGTTNQTIAECDFVLL